MIQECKPCKPNDYQDRRYGKFQRVHTPVIVKQGQQPMARCTVCLSEKPAKDGKQ